MRLFKTRIDRECDDLVSTASVFALATEQAVSTAFPEVSREIFASATHFEAWQFFATVACVGVAYDAIALGHAMPVANEYRKAVPDALRAWDRRADIAFQRFLENTDLVRPRFEREYWVAVGGFLLWNSIEVATRREPPVTLLTPAPAVGRLISDEFVEWWKR